MSDNQNFNDEMFINALPRDLFNVDPPNENNNQQNNENEIQNNIGKNDFNLNPFNDDKDSQSNSDDEFIFVESDIKNNFIPDTTQDETDENEDFVFKIQEDTNPNPFAQLKQQLNIGNTTSIPRVPSYPLQLSNLNNAFCLSTNSSNIMDELNNSFNNGNNQFYNAFGFLNNSFSMNGKSGWVCRACKNFNYEMRTQCNRCGKAQMMYKSQSIQSANTLSINQNGFIRNMAPLPFTGSHLNLAGGFNNFNQNNQNKAGYMSPLSMSPGNYSHSLSPKKKEDENSVPINNNIQQESKKKKKPFVEREGDWTCMKCKNLNFAFRTNCNRCHLNKNDNQKFIQHQQYFSSTNAKSNQNKPEEK